MFSSSLFGVPEHWSWRTMVTAFVSAVVVGVTGAWVPVPATAVVAEPSTDPEPSEVFAEGVARSEAGVLQAPDAASARLNASLTGEPVEDLSARTEFASTFANPDGTWEAVQAFSPVWVPSGEGDGTSPEDWSAFDASLVTGRGGLVARSHPARVWVSRSAQVDEDGVAVVASFTDPVSGVTTELVVDSDLPEPRVEGPRAVFEQVDAGVDLVVEVTATGIEQFFVVHEPLADPARALELGVRSEGAEVVTSQDGVVDLVADGDVVARVSDAVAWDAAFDATLLNPVTQEFDVTAQPPVWAGLVPAASQPDGPADDAGVAEDGQDTEPGSDLGVSVVVDTQVGHAFDVGGRGPGTDRESGETDQPSSETPAAELSEAVDDEAAADSVTYETEPESVNDGAEADDDVESDADGDGRGDAEAGPSLDDGVVLGLDPGQDFWGDTQVEFPVVVDPVASLSISYDAYVQKGLTSDTSLSTELRLGTYDGGSTVARTFMNAGVGPIRGTKVASATLRLWEFHSYSCTATNWRVYEAGLVSSSSRWTNQPSIGAQRGTSSQTKGYSGSCPAGWVEMDMTSIAQVWADGSASTQGFMLRAASETNSQGWKRFNSSNASSGRPTLSVTYNLHPTFSTGGVLTSGQSRWWTNPSTGSETLYIKTLTPTFNLTVSDPDGGNVRAQFHLYDRTDGKVIWNWVNGSQVASGGVSSYTPSTPLPAGHSFTLNVRAWDGSLASKKVLEPWRSDGRFTLNIAAPAAATITASAYTDGQWRATKPSSNTFTFASSSGDLDGFEYQLDGAATKWVQITPGAGQASVAWNPGAGSHTVRVRSVDRAGWVSAWREFSFGNGGAALSAPAAGLKSTDRFTVKASAPVAGSGQVTPSIWWRAAGSDEPSDFDAVSGSTTGWTKARDLAPVAAGSAVSVSSAWSAAAAAGELGKDRVPVLLDVQVCFTYSASGLVRCTWNAEQTHRSTVVRVPHAFGDGYPVAHAGPGQVALWTGEFNTAATDVSVPGYVGDLSVSRSYSTQAGAEDSVFGPGWRAGFDGTDIGAAGWEVVDNTGVDGTIALVDDEGDALVFRQPGDGRVLGKTGTYTPVDDETAEVGGLLRKTGSGSSARIIFTDPDGAVTQWSFAGTTTADRTWLPVSVTEPGSAGATTFTRQGKQITRILAPVPPGVTCPAPGEGILNPGCRAVDIAYGTTTGGGQVTGQVKSISYTAFDPAAGAMATIEVAAYEYDASKRLAKVTDPRTGLATTYSYAGTSTSGQPLLTQVTEPGMAPWKLAYASSSQDAKSLLTVHRGAASGTGADVQVSRFVYDVPRTGMGLPMMNAAGVSTWGQDEAPAYAAAVFGLDRPVGATPGTADWPYASLQYTDADGRVTNTASFGAGDWQVTATRYDDAGRVTHAWDEHATSQIKQIAAEQGLEALADELVGSFATITRYNAERTAQGDITWDAGTVTAGSVLVAAGTLVTDVWDPARQTDDGLVRTRTHTQYDQGAPNGGVNPTTGTVFNLPTTVTVFEADGLSGSPDPVVPIPSGQQVLTRQVSGYAPIDGKAATDPTSGWILGQATTTTTRMGTAGETSAADITTSFLFDDEGRTLEERRPGSSGQDAGTIRSGFYTAGPQSGVFAACGNKPQWAGLACATRTAEATASVPVSAVTGYSMYLGASEQVETLGQASRTTTTTFDAAGRPTRVHTTTSGVAGSQAVPATVTEYDPTTGLPVATVSVNGSGTETSRITTAYDRWGRQTSYTDASGATTTTSYDGAGRVGTVTDPYRATTYGYDGAGERRGLPTSVTIGGVGAFTATYGAGGNVVAQQMPGGLVQHSRYDRAGDLEGLSYVGSGGTELLAWSVTSDVRGNTTRIVSTGGGDGSGLGRVMEFVNDPADRLVRATDQSVGGCATREYDFDVRGNRLSQTSTDHDGPDCDGVEATMAKTWTFDAADRMQAGATVGGAAGGAYEYDALGRQTGVPAVDTPYGASSGNVTIGYYATDAARSVMQDGVTTTFQLDPAGRRSTDTTVDAGVGVETRRVYAGDGDNPVAATSVGDGGATITTWYGSSIGGDLGVTVTSSQGQPDAVEVALPDTLNNVATTITVPSGSGTPTTGAVGTWDEYGNTLTQGAATGVLAYGWAGAKQRATNPATGLLLMGARLYNPVTGHFTSTDPVKDGNTTPYTYPQDPINQNDLDGQRKTNSFWKNHGSTVVGGVRLGLSVAAMMGCVACGVVSVAWTAIDVARAKNGRQRAVAALGFVPAGFGSAARLSRAAYYARQTTMRKSGNYQASRQARNRGNAWGRRLHSVGRRLDRAAVAYDSVMYGRSTYRNYRRR